MNESLVLTLMCASFVILLFVIEVIYKRGRLNSEVSRKVIHIGVGLICIIPSVEYQNHWFVLFSSLGFILFLYLSKRFGWLPSLHGIQRRSIGAFLFPVSIYLCFLLYYLYDKEYLFYLPLILLTLCDPLASFAGMSWKKKNGTRGSLRPSEHSKTFVGALVFFLSALFISLVFLRGEELSGHHATWLALIIASVSTLAELLAYRGWDNLSITASSAGALVLYLEFI